MNKVRHRCASARRYYVYRPEGLWFGEGDLQVVPDWQAHTFVRPLVELAIAMLGGGGAKRPTTVYALPLLEPQFGLTVCRRAIILYAGGPTAIVSPLRLPAFRHLLSSTITLTPSTAEASGFPGTVASQARAASRALRDAVEPPPSDAEPFTSCHCAPKGSLDLREAGASR